MNLEHSVVLLTGASSGIGHSLAKLLPKENCSLALIARRKDLLDNLVYEIRQKNCSIKTYKCDVSVIEDVREVYNQIKNDFGKVDVTILNAGVSGRSEIADFNSELAQDILGPNILGITNWVDVLLPDLLNRKNGTIVGVSSIADLKGFPKSGLYNASKAAASIFLESLRIELKPYNIKVITVRPGFVRTPMTDKNEFYMPLLMDADKAAQIILAGIKKEKKIIQFPLLMVILAGLVRLLPKRLFEYLAGKQLPKRKD
ncbi:MAG: SDR family NAD(P)-dependent oxidoreductase [Ignavibacteria bacterium]|nr:SDR family NAD(P)-dependent oxidoreductase [Ignavibacteria bacterium]MBT8391775.1 SDR family NAD(P)-dependent oxidoreductase [Ignavibacteria bacterium]NNJ52345.1 SDR family NAD(P)-dependent oxidoreductase [Ignavibacteriaceae bacterium]